MNGKKRRILFRFSERFQRDNITTAGQTYRISKENLFANKFARTPQREELKLKLTRPENDATHREY